MLTGSLGAAGGSIGGTEVSSAHGPTPRVECVVPYGDPLDKDKSIELRAINIANDAADLPRFFLTPFLPAFFLRLGGLAPGGSSLISVCGLPVVCLLLLNLRDFPVRRDESRPDLVVDEDSLRVLLDW